MSRVVSASAGFVTPRAVHFQDDASSKQRPQTPTSIGSSLSSAFSDEAETELQLWVPETLLLKAWNPLKCAVHAPVVLLPSSGQPVLFRVSVASPLHTWAVHRRYAQFEAVQTELWWRGLAVDLHLPPKRPPPGYDRSKLEERGRGLTTWASRVLGNPASLKLPSVRLLFDLDAGADADALLRLQAAGRGYLARRSTSLLARGALASPNPTLPGVPSPLRSPTLLRSFATLALGLGSILVLLSIYFSIDRPAAQAVVQAIAAERGPAPVASASRETAGRPALAALPAMLPPFLRLNLAQASNALVAYGAEIQAACRRFHAALVAARGRTLAKRTPMSSDDTVSVKPVAAANIASPFEPDHTSALPKKWTLKRKTVAIASIIGRGTKAVLPGAAKASLRAAISMWALTWTWPMQILQRLANKA